MFHSARLKLTAWYLAIIMLISALFSLVIYTGINTELKRFEHLHQLRIEREEQRFSVPTFPRRLANIDPEMITETRNRLTLVLVLINLGILVVSGGAAYFLAGRTLKPIKGMIDEQNRFISDSSHELRTPLTSLKSTMEVSLRDKHLTLKDSKSLIAESIEEVNKLQSLSDELLQLAQYQKPNDYAKFEKMSLAEVMKKAISKVEPLAKQKNIVVQDDSQDIEIEGNKYGLCDLLVILLDNAIKYSGDMKTVKISSKKTDGFVNVSVKDQGIGIDEKDIPHLFDRFFRADTARGKTTAPGYGLGLSIAKKIVDIHHGSITVESKLNRGSTFTVNLPINQSFHLKRPLIFS